MSERASHPSDLVRFVVQRINAGDLDGLVALYEPDAILAIDDGKVVVGKDAIRAFYQSLLMTKPQFMPGQESPPLINGGLALTSSTLTNGTTTAEVARQQSDGSWLWVIDQPAIAKFQIQTTDATSGGDV
jgi:ketosteroid isomerase-like protein